ncbi:MAG: tetratricopeptide repeat protein, partial [Bryobacteraceae bacterium]
MRIAIFLLGTVAMIPMWGQQMPDSGRLMDALKDRALADQAMRIGTDERIKMYQTLVMAQPETFHYQNLLAATYIQKVRETTDFSYLDRAAKVLEGVLAHDGDNYEALRLRTEIELERHDFKRAAESSRRLTQIAPHDAWNWGTLGDAMIELGNYDQAAEAYQRMMNIKPDLSSYNRAAYFRFLVGDMPAAIAIMKEAIAAGSPASENVAWCAVELGHLYLKAGNLDEAERAYGAAAKVFPRYHPALAGLGHVAKLRGQTVKGIEFYKRAQAGTPLPDYAAALYDLYTAAGQKDEAKKQMDMVDLVDKMGLAAKEKANRNLAMIYADHDYR